MHNVHKTRCVMETFNMHVFLFFFNQNVQKLWKKNLHTQPRQDIIFPFITICSYTSWFERKIYVHLCTNEEHIQPWINANQIISFNCCFSPPCRLFYFPLSSCSSNLYYYYRPCSLLFIYFCYYFFFVEFSWFFLPIISYNSKVFTNTNS